MKIFVLLLTFCIAQATFPEVSIGKNGSMKVSVIALIMEETQALVVPSEALAWFITNHVTADRMNYNNVVDAFDPNKITTCLLLFPHDSPQASLNVALGGEQLSEKDYFAVHYQKQGEEWLPKIMVWENVKSDGIWKKVEEIYTFSGGTYENQEGPHQVTPPNWPISKTFKNRMAQIAMPARGQAKHDWIVWELGTPVDRPSHFGSFNRAMTGRHKDGNIFYVQGGGQTIVQKAPQEEEEVASVVLREMQTVFDFRGRAKFCVVSIVPFVSFNPKYAKHTDKLKLVNESIMAALKNGDPDDILGYQSAVTDLNPIQAAIATVPRGVLEALAGILSVGCMGYMLLSKR
jgi:hypothetical protein